MNIELLSKMVKELLLDNDTVNLPGLGSFVAEIVPATFSDSGHTINPPYRKLYFRDNIEREDELLVKMYAAENGVTEEDAAEVISGFVGEVKDLLNSRKSVVMPELGRLRATKENNYFFVPFENIDIYPEGEGLEPVPLKLRAPQTEIPEEGPVTESEPEETSETTDQIETTETSEEPAPEEISEDTETTNLDEPAEEMSEEVSAESAEGIPTEEQSDEEPVVLNGVEVVRLGGPSESPENPDDSAPEEKSDEPAPVSPTVAPDKQKSAISKGWLRAIIVIGSILLAAAFLILLFIILSYIFPDYFDQLLWH